MNKITVNIIVCDILSLDEKRRDIMKDIITVAVVNFKVDAADKESNLTYVRIH